jgi:hypothetical protein
VPQYRLMRARTFTLEPIGKFAFLTTLVHALLVLGFLGWWKYSGERIRGAREAALHWTSPGDFTKALSEPAPVAAQETRAVSSNTPPAPASPPPTDPAPLKPASPMRNGAPPRIEIAISKITPKALPVGAAKASAQKIEAAGDDSGVDMSAVDRAIVEAFRHAWMPPRPAAGPATAHADVRLDRKGQVTGFHLVKPSGDEAIDLSVHETGAAVTSVSCTFPANYSRDDYAFQVHFHAE